MADLILTPNIAKPDDLYERLVTLLGDLDAHEGALFSSKLILLLANHIGNEQVINEAVGHAMPNARRE